MESITILTALTAAFALLFPRIRRALKKPSASTPICGSGCSACALKHPDRDAAACRGDRR